MLLELFVVGSLWFWLLIAFCVITVAIAVDTEGYGVANLILLLVLLALWLLGDFNVFKWIKDHPVQLLGGLAVYIFAGVMWSFTKWIWFVHNQATKVANVRQSYLKENTRPVLPENATEEQKEEHEVALRRFEQDYHHELERNRLISHDRDGQKTYRPLARNHKERIIGWIGYWPVSLLWALLHDLVRKVSQMIYNSLVGRYEAVSKRIFDKADLNV